MFDRKGYGFLKDTQTSETFYFHVSEVPGRRVLQSEQLVTFVVAGEPKREKAVDIQLVSAPAAINAVDTKNKTNTSTTEETHANRSSIS
jgi:cold shock CspA family protein